MSGVPKKTFVEVLDFFLFFVTIWQNFEQKEEKHLLICLGCEKFGGPMEMLRKGVFTFLFSMLDKIRLCVDLKDFIVSFIHPMGLLDEKFAGLIFKIELINFSPVKFILCEASSNLLISAIYTKSSSA
jgi:hypothetical protein